MEFYSRELKKSFYLDDNDNEKFIVFCCAKNEDEYLVEWVEHYLNLGFDKIIIADNNDIGNNNVEDFLQDYINCGKVQIFDCRGMECIQIPIYSDFCEFSYFKWCAFYDCDEFLEIENYTNIKDYLATKDCDCICFNWLMFGPNGQYHKKEGNVQERFPLPLSPVMYFRENCFIKSIVRGNNTLFKDCWFNGSHLPYLPNSAEKIHYSLGGYIDIYDNYINHSTYPLHYKEGYIKHYYTKSFDEWVKKSNRGWPDNTPKLNTSNYFVFNENLSIPISFITYGLFDGNDEKTQIEKDIESNRFILIKEKEHFSYALFGNFIRLLRSSKNKIFGLLNIDIDDCLYAIFLEYAYITGNKICLCKNIEDFWIMFDKYPNKENNNSFYALTFD